MKNAFYFILKALFVFKIFRFLSLAFGHVENLKIYGVTAWSTNNYNTHIAQYITKLSQTGNEIWCRIWYRIWKKNLV